MSSHTLCSCGNSRCLTSESVRLWLETTDNIHCLKAEAEHLERLKRFLARISEERQLRLTQWQRDQERYYACLTRPVRLEDLRARRANDLRAIQRSTEDLDLQW